MLTQRLPAEWEPQDAIILVWPTKTSLWNSNFEEVTELYEALATVICDFADVVVVVEEINREEVESRLKKMGAELEYIHFLCVPTNDTWVRDTGPITVETSNGFKLLDFQFNGWGNKFPHELDNALPAHMHQHPLFQHLAYEKQDWILEAGSIETDGQGCLLTTSSCLLNKNRNPSLSKQQIEKSFKAVFGVTKIHWLDYGFLQGDDTDGHIDTLARLCPDNTIIYTACDDQEDEHFEQLKKMEQQLEKLTNIDNQPYRLLPLPWAGKVLHRETARPVPATYANFLIVNHAVLVPIYDLPADEDAIEVVSQAFPGFEIMGIPCMSLIERGGSLHCITMQLPQGVLGENA